MIIPHLASAVDYPPNARVWVYTANRPLTNEEAEFAAAHLKQFCQQWTAHNQALKATAEVFENQILVLMVDETAAGASGCSIDKSVHFLTKLGEELGADFFERMRFAWVDEQGDGLRFANRPEFAALVNEGKITQETLMVDTLVQDRAQLLEKWLVPFGQSWHKRLV